LIKFRGADGAVKELLALKGESTYDIAVRFGNFKGTEKQWIDRLVLLSSSGRLETEQVPKRDADVVNKLFLESMVEEHNQSEVAHQDLRERVGACIKDVSYDGKTGVFTFLTDGGEEHTVDLPLEQIVVGGEYDEESNNIYLNLANGSVITIDASKIGAAAMSNKVDKVTTTGGGRCYGVSSIGNQTMYSIAEPAFSRTLVFRDWNGRAEISDLAPDKWNEEEGRYIIADEGIMNYKSVREYTHYIMNGMYAELADYVDSVSLSDIFQMKQVMRDALAIMARWVNISQNTGKAW
jgi:hypothetical protein